MQSFRQIFAAFPVELADAAKPQGLDQACEPMPLDVDLLSHVSGGGTVIPVGGW